jgi:omega-6 fatty acid desaturase (delta-12 desaturase)
MESLPQAEKSEIRTEEGEKQPFFSPPTYTMKEIHDAIPIHCFERNTLLSIAYVARDFLFVFALSALATQIPRFATPTVRFSAWVAYAFTQGLVFTGLWELAHESGHGALSKSKAVNNSIGLLIHSLLFVPYHSWRFTHSQHHKATNNIERDIAFVPDTKDVYMAARAARTPEAFFTYWDLVEDTPIVTLLTLIGHQLVAWPIYLIINNFALPRMRAEPWWKRSHFYFGGDGPNFKPQNRDDVLLSDLGIVMVAGGLWFFVQYFGAWNVALFYGFPWLWTNHWIRTFFFQISFHHELTLFSHNNFPSTHRSLAPVLPHSHLVVPPWCCLNGGSRVWHH